MTVKTLNYGHVLLVPANVVGNDFLERTKADDNKYYDIYNLKEDGYIVATPVLEEPLE